ncbi:MAG: YdcF family protein [Acutalibacteraceae bacterium]
MNKILFSLALLFSSSVITFCFAEKKASKGNCTEEPDYLLILGCRVKGDKAEKTLETRIDAAAKYLSEHKNVLAVCCGGIVHADQTKSEAQVIADELAKRGIEKERLILEDKSTTTEENFINAKRIIESMETGNVTVAFLSSEFHLLRAGIIAKRAGVDASSISAPSLKEKRFQNYIREFIVFPAAYRKGRK